MSSSEGEQFDFEQASDNDSESYTPVKKAKAPAKTKATTTKAAPAKSATKPKAPPKKKVLVDHDDNAEDFAMDLDDDESVPSGSGKKAVAATKKKTVSEKYTKLSQLEHILKRPDSYIGSVELVTQPMWTFDPETKRMVHRDVQFVPGFYKIVDEILVNAADNKRNDSSMDTIKINIDVDEGTISVFNNGRGIPIEMHSTEKCYIPELIFGHLLSGSNYDDDEKKLVGGRNGFGAKLANIYSHEFTIETADKNTAQKYKQTWTNNMTVCGKPKITKNSKGEEYTKVTFRPDLKRFGMESIDKDTASLLQKRAYDMAGVVKDVKVWLNDERLKIKDFKQYVELYINSVAAEAADAAGGAGQNKQSIIHQKLGDRWEIAFAVSDGSFQHVSFANSISTSKGGSHVNLIADQISKALITHITKKNKAATVKPHQIKNHMWLFINALIENPTFDSQTKEQLTLTASKFGSKPSLTEDFLKKVAKSPIVDNVLNWAKYKADQQIKKTDGSKRSRITGLAKLTDANNAGTKHAKDCTLILTEGDSAKSLAVAGLSVVGRDNFGVFPLRGKLLNVRDAKHDQIMKNEEIKAIKTILGLQHNKEYTSTASLRYGRLMIMADQDHDGSHIKGLIINFLDHFYPSLLKVNEFLVEFVTPIVRVSKGSQKKEFFTIPEYEQWAEATTGSDKWKTKYFKGLGTSTDEDARQYFSRMPKHMIPFATRTDEDRDAIDLAFSKKKTDDRKEWLRQFVPGTFLDHNLEEIPYTEFINKELILFSMADNIRSIPSVADGFKPVQRKVIWSCFKRNLTDEVRVAQLVGYVSEKACYHHGEASLASTIINLAQEYVGSNNMNFLRPAGQFGTRDSGGKDAASARYIHTDLLPITRMVLHPADDPLLKEQKDETHIVEPEYYLPIVPTILINGAEGIGTGWSTNIPCYNPTEIVANLRRLMNGEELVPMHPWWRGFKGEVVSTGKNKYDVLGIVTKRDDSTVEITELPIHRWTGSFKEQLEAMMVGGEKVEGSIKNYHEHHANHDVHFVVQMDPKELEKAEKQGFIDYFKLRAKVSTSNMMAFDFDGRIKKYDSPEAILEEFYPIRLEFYQKRKDALAKTLETELDRLNNQARFVQMIVDKELNVSRRKKADIIADLKKHKFRPFPKKKLAKEAGEVEAFVEDKDEDDEDSNSGSSGDYDYLLGMPIYNLTLEKIQKLLAQAADKENQLVVLLKLTPKDMWNTDLDTFLQQWQQTLEDHKNKVSGSKPKGKRKQGVLQTRKSLGGGGDRSDEDFKPVKAPARRKAPAAPKAKAVKDEDDDVVMAASKKDAPKRQPAKKAPKPVSDIDSDIEVDDKPAAKKTVKAVDIDSDSDDDFGITSKGKGKGKVKSTSDDDDYGFDEPPKAKPKPRAVTKRKSLETADESDDEPPQAKGKGKTAPKRKSLDALGDDSDDEAAASKQPPKKKQATQTTVADFFGKAGGSAESSKASKPKPTKITQKMKPASPPKAKKPAIRVADSDDELDYDLPAPPPRGAAPGRAARNVKKPTQYVDISDDEEHGDASMFVDSD